MAPFPSPVSYPMYRQEFEKDNTPTADYGVHLPAMFPLSNRSLQPSTQRNGEDFRPPPPSYQPRMYDPYSHQSEAVNDPYNSRYPSIAEQWDPYQPLNQYPYHVSPPGAAGPSQPGPPYMHPGPGDHMYQLSPIYSQQQQQQPQQQPQKAPSPMVVSPAPRGRRPQTRGKRGGVSGVIHNFRKIAITRARYNKIKSNIRNKFCQRKTRKRKDAKIASAEKKDEIFKQIYARMVVEKTGREEEDGMSLNDHVDRIAMAEYHLQREKRQTATYESLMAELMETIRLEKKRLEREEADIAMEADEKMKEALDKLKNTHTVIDGGESDDDETIVNDESDEKEED